MLRAIQRLGAGCDSAGALADTLTLTFEQRQRGRLRAVGDSGSEIGLFLDRGPVLRDGDCLATEDSQIVVIRAAAEPVVTAYVASGLPLARLCYHLGNRHVPLAIGETEDGQGYVRLQPDHVLEALAERLGARLERHDGPFDPEPGAYAAGEGHSHGHHTHDHNEHKHTHEH
ncbi:urease accessory protein UreE [Phytohalomonas tamaricis]|uniref:urease accessory protein UreE n=1 Tax=Phytohalomonas tamaricis TaxID=2081032 RepID=UPI000D0BA89D|nr:urease accessory protein UreE [Phytohalomonas tamaricis]